MIGGVSVFNTNRSFLPSLGQSHSPREGDAILARNVFIKESSQIKETLHLGWPLGIVAKAVSPRTGYQTRKPSQGPASETFHTLTTKPSMPRIFWTPGRDEVLRRNYPLIGPDESALLLGTSRRSVINRAFRLSLKAPYPQHRAKSSFPPKSWSTAEKHLAQALLDLFRSSLSSPGDQYSYASTTND
jgi:hypothetical protein